MAHVIEHSTLRILNPKGKTVGTGFLIAKDLAVTCAHVIIDADAYSGDSIKIQFAGKNQQLDAQVLPECWGDLDKNDVAFLRLTNPPQDIEPLRLGLAAPSQPGSPFYSFGYTNAAGEQGLGTDARIITLAPGSHFLQLSSDEAYYGMSGAPVYDKERKVVVGMINKGHVERQFALEIAKLDSRNIAGKLNIDLRSGITYAIPTETLVRICPEIELHQEKRIVRHPLVEGINRLPYDYSQRIENFLTEYLGNDTRRIPFGGRAIDLATLDAWLEQSGEPYCLLAAPAGRGKSALLVRWLDRLLERANALDEPGEILSLAFIPVSIRFGTNLERVFYASLAARLAYLHGDEIPASPETSTDVYRGLVSDYLSKPLANGQALLVVLDGLDEAADWKAGADFMPTNLPNGVRVVVSARFLAGNNESTGWLSQLNWTHPGLALAPELPPLNRLGVADVLNKMNRHLDQLSRNVDIVTELYRLSLGDPLLVGLYVGDLLAKGDQVAHLKPEDLSGVMPGYNGYFERWWDDQKKLWKDKKPWLENHIRTVRNLLAGAISPLGMKDLQALAPELEYDYISDALDVLQRFIIGDKDNGFTYSHPKLGQYFWDALSGAEQTKVEQCFLNWCEQVLDELVSGKRDTARKSQVPGYVVTNYTAHLLRARQPIGKFLRLVQEQAWEKAWFRLEGAYGGYSQDVQRVWNQCRTLDRLETSQGHQAIYIGQQIRCGLIEASLHSLAGNVSARLIPILVREKVWTMPQTWVFIRQMPDEKQKANAIGALIHHLDDEQRLEALQTAQAIQNEYYRAGVLSTLAQYLPDQVLIASQSIQSEYTRASVLSSLAQYQPDQVLTIARQIKDNYTRANILCTIAQYHPAVLDEALQTARAVEHKESRAHVLSIVASLRPDIVDEALQAIQDIQHEWQRTRVLSTLAPHRPEQILKFALNIKGEWQRTEVLSALAPYLPEQVFEATLPIQHDDRLSRVLSALAPYLPEQVFASIYTVHEDQRAEILSALAPYRPDQVFTAAREIENEWKRAEVLSALAPHRPELVLQATQSMQSDWQKMEVLSDLAIHRPEVVDDALQATRGIQDERQRTTVLIALAPHCPDQVLDATKNIQNEWQRASVLMALAPYRPHQLFDAARDIQDEWQRANVLSALMPRQPEQVMVATQDIQTEWERARAKSAIASLRPEVIDNALKFTREIQDDKYRAIVLSTLTDLLIGIPKNKCYPAIETALLTLSQRKRSDLFSDITELLPVFIHIGKEGTVQDIFQAVQDVSTWWP